MKTTCDLDRVDVFHFYINEDQKEAEEVGITELFADEIVFFLI